jgi:hypothetical protein
MSYANGPRIVTDGLVCCLDAANRKSYPGSGTSFNDLTGINTATLQNDPTYTSTNYGNFDLDGTNDRILISCASNRIRTYNSTTEFVVKLPVVSGGQKCILSYRVGGRPLYIGKRSGYVFSYYNTLNTAAFINGALTANEIMICHVVCDASNNLLKHYVNGSLTGSASRTGWYTSYQGYIYLGHDAGGTNEYMDGNFYRFSHYDKVLTNDEIAQNYNALKGRYS